MTEEELVAKDLDFNTSLFLSRANNFIKMMFIFISSGEVEKIKPFVSEEVFKKIDDKVSLAKENGEKVNYDEINVSCEIKDIVDNSTNVEIIVNATTKYLKYYTAIDDGHFLRGNTNERVKVIHIVTFQKKNGEVSHTYNCLGCGAPINIYENSNCPNCGRAFDFADFDFIIKSFD